MKLLFALYATLAGALWPRCTEECAWRCLKCGCGYMAAYWMSLGAWSGLQSEASRETERLKPSYRRDALAELGETR